MNLDETTAIGAIEFRMAFWYNTPAFQIEEIK